MPNLIRLQNDSFVMRIADRFADRVRREVGDRTEDQVVRAYELAFARSPDSEELQLTIPLAEAHGLAALCRVLLNTNEFLYVD